MTDGSNSTRLSLARQAAATAALLSVLWGQPPAVAAEFEIISDQKSTVTGSQLCLAVDRTKPLTPVKDITINPPSGGKPFAVSGMFYPAVSIACDAANPDLLSKWTFTDTRELRIVVNGSSMCLSARFMTSFTPLLDPFLNAFKANEQGSSFSYLTRDLKRDGQINVARLRANPDLVVSSCGRVEATDFWVYDHINGMISGPAGWDDQRPRQRQCVTMHGDWNFRPPKHDAGMPVSAADCPELRSFKRDGPAHQRWRISAGTDALPTYVEAQDYFSGANGLPITGPMGRCLTADFPQKIAVTSDCDGRVEQNWRVNGDLIQLGPQGDCLTRDEGGAVKLNACTNAADQKWSYVVLDPIPNPRWLNASVYGQIRPSGASGQCLIVANDPFTDPVRQRNPVKVAACSAVLPRQTSWFRPTSVRTIRLALLRFSDDDGGKPALGNLPDADAKRIMESVASRLSEHYRTMGVRFVFQPEHDYMRVNDTVANQKTRAIEGAFQITKVAAGALYGKATLVVTTGMGGGGFSGADPAEYEPSRLVHWINRTPIGGNYPGLPKDRAGLPAVAYYVAEAGINASSAGVPHHAHEFGHYLGLVHTFGPDEFADTPDDTIDGQVWLRLGTVTCGNPRTAVANGKSVTPDRLNNEGYWGCLLGRTNNSFSPLQLGKATWVLNNQLNRYPLVACQPIDAYDANKVECENAESFALCQQTASYLKDKIGIVLACQMGGTYSRAITAALQQPAVLHLLQNTPAGQSFISKLAGGRPAAASFAAVSDALKSCQNLPLTMALITRLGEFRELANQRHSSLARNGFAVKGAPLAVADQQAVVALSAQVLTAAFIANVPSIVSR